MTALGGGEFQKHDTEMYSDFSTTVIQLVTQSTMQEVLRTITVRILGPRHLKEN